MSNVREWSAYPPRLSVNADILARRNRAKSGCEQVPQTAVGRRAKKDQIRSQAVLGNPAAGHRQLPENRGELEYRIKSLEEAHERVARESELTRPGLRQDGA